MLALDAAVPVASCSLDLDWDDESSNPIEGSCCPLGLCAADCTAHGRAPHASPVPGQPFPPPACASPLVTAPAAAPAVWQCSQLRHLRISAQLPLQAGQFQPARLAALQTLQIVGCCYIPSYFAVALCNMHQVGLAWRGNGWHGGVLAGCGNHAGRCCRC